jgi:alanyl-tRNA synthetase
MMTKKLYYENPYIDSFTTNFIKQEVDENGNLYVVLEDTAFYPTGGGQPHDTGFLNECHVFNVEDIDGEIRHYLNKPLEETSEVNGSINWDRRFDHMQQHAGQHLLSAAFEELYNYKTVSFHLGKDFLTIDLDIQDLKEEESLRAEELANKIVLEGRAIETKWVTKEELSGYPLRKQVSVEDNIRLVIVPDFDYNGCGGTHPASTSQVGTIKILGWEKQGKKIRVQFICGNRVVMQFHNKNKVLTELSRLLSAPAEELAQTVVQLRETMKQLDKSLQEAKEVLLQRCERHENNCSYLSKPHCSRTAEVRKIYHSGSSEQCGSSYFNYGSTFTIRMCKR